MYVCVYICTVFMCVCIYVYVLYVCICSIFIDHLHVCTGMQSSSLKLFNSAEQKPMLVKRQAFAMFSGELDQYHLYLPLIQGTTVWMVVCEAEKQTIQIICEITHYLRSSL